MAKLTENQLKLRATREKKKQQVIREKMEVQKKKELYGENWKRIEQQKIKDEIEADIGGDYAPKIGDSKDLYECFSPVALYKDKEYKALKMDYKMFSDSERKYRDVLEELDEQLERIKEYELAEDGVSPEDSIPPAEPAEIQAYEEREATKASKGSKSSKGVKNSDIDRELTPQAIAKQKFLQKVAIYFNRFAPLYNKHICTCCGGSKGLQEYYTSYNLATVNRIDVNGSVHMCICKDCANKLFSYCYSVLSNKNVELAMQYTCAYLNLYWDVDLFYVAKKRFDEGGRKGTLLGSYIATINQQATGKTFMDSPFLTDEQYNSANRVISNPDEAPFDWSKEDARNKTTVLKMVGYDPFAYETDENKRILYKDLLNILDEGMQNDLVKFQAGIQIVLSFFKLRQLNEREYKLTQENAPISELKALSDLKAKELTAITNFSRDNGFSERFATAKAKGENTLTGIMSKMNEQKYEKGILNKYDIETSATIQQAADASFKAIFGQLSLGESEVWKITQEQFEELTKLRKENSRLQEELRKAKYRVSELNLLEKEREMKAKLGIEEEEY